jgi:tetratricopeptide (TPR) repeat protein
MTAFPAPGPAVDPVLRQTLSQAIELYARGEAVRARADLEALAARWPGSPELSMAIGTLLHQAGHASEAEAWYRRCLAAPLLDAGLRDAARTQLAAAVQVQGRLSEAETLWSELLASRPDDADALRNLGTLLKDRDEPARALDCYRRATALRRRRLRPDEVTALAGNPQARRTTRHKLKLELEQLEHLAERRIPVPDLAALLAGYRAVLAKLEATPGDHRVVLTPEQFRRVGATLHRLAHDAPAPRQPGGVLSPGLDFGAIEARYLSHPPGLVVVDRFLRPEALEALRDYCLESTIWFDWGKARGYCGAYLDDGFGCDLLLQLAEELRAAMPTLLGPLHLEHQWAYIYDQALSGITAHADPAKVNLNFWLTPDEANLEPESGGLVVWTREAPREWDFDEYNNRPDDIEAFAATSDKVVVPHRRNRLVMFNSNLVHKTDDFRFSPGFTNRRINVTMLFGRRSGRTTATH